MAMSIPEHPIIQNMERTGYPDGREPQYPHCPICGSECNTVYLNDDMEVIGCEECVRPWDAWQCMECFPEED